MYSRTFARTLTACTATVTMLAAVPAVRAQQDTTTAQGDSANSAGAEADGATAIAAKPGRVLGWGLTAGYGSLHGPGSSRGGKASLLEVTGSLRLSKAVSLMVSQASASGSSDGDPATGWTVLQVRFRPASGSRLFLQAGAGRADAFRKTVESYESTDLSSCKWTWFLIPIPTECQTTSHTRTDYEPTSGPVMTLGFGFELPLGRSAVLVPLFLAMPGHAGLSGFSLGLHFGGTKPVMDSQ